MPLVRMGSSLSPHYCYRTCVDTPINRSRISIHCWAVLAATVVTPPYRRYRHRHRCSRSRQPLQRIMDR